jgi:cobalt-precorrin-5B (C1)-methyltransferase
VKKKKLRSGYTTGACAAAAAKAAAELLLGNRNPGDSGVGARCNVPLRRDMGIHTVKAVEIPLPDSSRVKFGIQRAGFRDQCTAWASVIKDAGDDPDVTNGAEIVAEATIVRKRGSEEAIVGARRAVPLQIIIKGGEGVGTVTKPGLSVPVGGAAINPVPQKMIEEAVREAVNSAVVHRHADSGSAPTIEITIIVPQGEELAKKTLNYRLGIVGGISILGTTGIVKPVSSEAWTATIASSMDVAKATGLTEIVLSAGRSSEKAHMKTYNLPEESYVLMGDYLEYSLLEARKHEFKKIYLCAQWAKMLKIAMATPQTHVRFGAINTKKAVEFLNLVGINIQREKDFNTAREIFDWIISNLNAEARHDVPLQTVCRSAKKYAEKITGGVPVASYLVSYKGEILASSE